jgi:GH24 family phage-related lysozyme (muramidase)
MVPVISDRAINILIGFEISSPAFYETHLSHPVWPGGGSGVTIGIGYDLGEHTVQQVTEDWSPHLDDQSLALLLTVAGVRGDAASERVYELSAIVVPFAAAQAVFSTSTLPQFADDTAKAVPKCDELSGDSFGALVSLSYNRGAGGFTRMDDRYIEMRGITAAMAQGLFSAVPGFIRKMKRIWQDADGNPLPGCAGLLTRRDAEADLFESGLAPLIA